MLGYPKDKTKLHIIIYLPAHQQSCHGGSQQCNIYNYLMITGDCQEKTNEESLWAE